MQLLALIDTLYDGEAKETPTIDRNFRDEVWKSLKSHSDILIGENGHGNSLELREVEENPSEAPKIFTKSHREPTCTEWSALPKTLSGVTERQETVSIESTEGMTEKGREMLVNEGGADDDVDGETPTAQAESPFTTVQEQATEPELVIFDAAPLVSSQDSVQIARLNGISGARVSEQGNQITEQLPVPTGPKRRGRPPKAKKLDLATSKTDPTTLTGFQDGTHREDIRVGPGNDASATGCHQEDKTTLAVPPRRRGRPPKVKAIFPTLVTSVATPQATPTSDLLRLENVLSDTSAEPKRRPGRPRAKQSIFTSHDQSQRDAGIAGVYFDLPELNQATAGRPRKRMIAVIKSEKLKSIPWVIKEMTEEKSSCTTIQPVKAVESVIRANATENAAGENKTLTRKRSHEAVPETPTDEPPRKKSLLDMVRDFGKLPPTPYVSPYQAPQATSYVSPFRIDASLVTPPSHNDSPHEAPSTASSQDQVPSPLGLAKALPSIVKYISPYPPMEIPRSIPVELLSTSISNVTNRKVVESAKPMKDEQLESAIKAAGELIVPDITIRLPSSKDGVAGNLCLSKDKRSLVFLIGEEQTESAAIAIQVSDIIKPPQTSTLGSEPMILQITTSKGDDVEETLHFRFLPTEVAFQTANNMRAKIVTAMMRQRLESNDEVVELVKLFKCSGCDGTWKNMEGLKYHSTKSKTSCNPNYQPKVSPRVSLHTKNFVETEESTLQVDQDSLGLATPRVGESVQNFSGGSIFARSKLKSSSKVRDGYRASGSSFDQQPAVAGNKLKDNHPQTGLHGGKDIIIELLNANGQVFPGEKGLWFAYVAAFLQKYPDSGLPNYTVCNNVLDLLIGTGQVRKVQFSFKDSTGVMKIRTLITLHDVDPMSDEATTMKEKMKTAFPDHYVPVGFAPPVEIQSVLEERERQLVNEKGSNKTYKHISQDNDPIAEQGYGNPQASFNNVPSSKVTRSGRTSRRPQRLQAVDDRLLLPEIIGSSVRNPEEAMGSEEDDSYAEDHSQWDTASRVKVGGRKRKRSTAVITKSKGANAIRWAEPVPNNNPMLSPQTIEDVPLQETESDNPRRKRQKVGSRSTIAVANQNGMWQQPAMTFLQGTNGAWDNQTPPRIPHKYTYKNRLPEPVTYMQTLNDAAWHFRPFGHGVRPIFARPTKRSEGSKSYLARIENGFRPVLMKTGETHTLAMPSRDETATESPPRAAKRPCKQYKRQSSALLEDQAETSEPPAKKRRGRPPKNATLESSQSEFEEALRDIDPILRGLNHRVMDPSFDSGPRAPIPALNPGLQYGAERPIHTGSDSLSQSYRNRAFQMGLSASFSYVIPPPISFRPPLTPRSIEFKDPDKNSDSGFTPPQARQASISTNDSDSVRDELLRDSSRSVEDNDEPYIVRWQEPKVLTSFSGLWLAKDNEEFEIGSGSFTMNESFPSTEFAPNQLLPRGLDDNLATHPPPPKMPRKHPSSQEMGDNSLTLESLPHDEIDIARKDEGSIIPKNAHQQLQNGPIPQYMMKSRRLTALPADVEHVNKYLLDHPELKVEVAFGHQHDHRRRTKEGTMSPDMDYRLMVAVVVIRTLTGGLDKQIDWVLVSKLFPNFPMNYVSKRWQYLLPKHKEMIERLGPDFQEFFLEAYESGGIPAIDYDHLLDYDWDGLLDLVLERIDMNPNKATAHELPDSRGGLNQMYDIYNAENNNKAWRDDYFGLLPPVYKRLDHAASEQYSTAISQEAPSNYDIDELTVAKSWARANTLTPAGAYDKDFAASKLATLGNNTIKAATTSLFESKVLMQRNKGRPLPDRGVEITDTFAAGLRKHLDEKHLTQAAAFKAGLDAKLRAGEVVMVEWAANDGDVLAITNLQAHGRIKLEPKGVPMNRFGLTGGGYQTKKMDKAQLLFSMQIIPTDKYIFDDDLPILEKLTENFEPPRGIKGAIPMWYDIAENLIPTWWKKTLCVVLGMLAMRPGIEIKELVRLFNPAIEGWEMRLLLEWGVRVGALKVLREGHEGWTVGEWWWAIGGQA